MAQLLQGDGNRNCELFLILIETESIFKFFMAKLPSLDNFIVNSTKQLRSIKFPHYINSLQEAKVQQGGRADAFSNLVYEAITVLTSKPNKAGEGKFAGHSLLNMDEVRFA